MPVEKIIRPLFPDSDSPQDPGAWIRVLEAIGEYCAARLDDAGFFTAGAANEVLGAYQHGLRTLCDSGNPTMDFIAFTAETLADRQGRPVEGEVSRMQKILLLSLRDRVRLWSFGMLPGAVDGLYCHCVRTRAACESLGCPSMLGGEASIVHVTALNPVTALAAAAWIRQELSALATGEAPFVFSLVLDLPSWRGMMKRHFGDS